jgi:hypothetical protein
MREQDSNHSLTVAQVQELANSPACAWYTSSCGRIELALQCPDAALGYHSGACDDDIAALVDVPYIAQQLAEITPAIAQEVATESGRNDYGQGPEDMTDHAANLRFILWMACSDIISNS